MSGLPNPAPPADPEPAEPRRSDRAPAHLDRVALMVLASASAMAVLYWARDVFIPIVLSILISYALEPLVRGMTRLRVHRVVASALVIALLTGTIACGAYSLADDASAVLAEMPRAAAKLRQTVRRDQPSAIQHVQRAAQELQRTADETAGPTPAPRGVQRVQIEEPAINVREYFSLGSARAFAFAGQAALIVFFTLFLLASGDLFKRKFVKVAGPSMNAKKQTVHILEEINRQIERFLVVRVVASALVAVATWIALALVGLEHAALWGLAAGILNSVPYFGPLIVAAATFVAAFLQFDALSMAVYVGGITLVVTSLEGWLLTPWLTSRAAKTNEVAIFVGLIFWTFVWGLWGTILAVPMLVAVKAVCDHVDSLEPLGELLGK